ncbi:MAG: 50S ribosomal protein L7ae [Ruminococcaceae bacterium]|nr:50S ribosomal protein L7ae [Oscillospiraceae bacterium]
MQENKLPINDDAEGKKKRFKFALSLARRAGSALCGASLVCDAIRDKKEMLVVLSNSASENSKKRVSNCASYYQTKILYTNLTPEELGGAVGKSALACIGVTDKNLAFNVERNLY